MLVCISLRAADRKAARGSRQLVTALLDAASLLEAASPLDEALGTSPWGSGHLVRHRVEYELGAASDTFRSEMHTVR
jgi:hypothetical protein